MSNETCFDFIRNDSVKREIEIFKEKEREKERSVDIMRMQRFCHVFSKIELQIAFSRHLNFLFLFMNVFLCQKYSKQSIALGPYLSL